MMLSPKLHIKQTQSLVITPQLMQAIRLLQMSTPELAEFVESELQQNPLLSRYGDAEFDRRGGPGIGEADTELPDGGIVNLPDALRQSTDQLTDAIDVSAADMFPDIGAPGDGRPDRTCNPDRDRVLPGAAGVSGRPAAGSNHVMSDRQENLPGSQSLVAMIETAITAVIRDPAKQLIALALLADLDSAGYLGTPLSEIAEKLGVSREIVESVLRQCRELAPSGVFAGSLKECLALQLAERDRLDPAMQALLDNLDMLAARRTEDLCACCGVDREDLEAMIAELRELDPKPGQAFAEIRPQIVVPDIFVRRTPTGSWAVELNDETLPRVLVDREYYAEVVGQVGAGEDKKFITECMQQATWLAKSLDQRARTILNVSAEIVRQQDAFLTHGVSRLRPLNLRAIAESIGMHESTISRATANKYLATPRGIFELKYFFSSSIPAAGGGDGHSAESVKHRIRGLIDNELPGAILSDDAIVDQLRPDGIVIARRTVAKYRDLMHIPSSVERRREKRAAGRR
jgi:RNA polymerase sigma-54 factor